MTVEDIASYPRMEQSQFLCHAVCDDGQSVAAFATSYAATSPLDDSRQATQVRDAGCAIVAVGWRDRANGVIATETAVVDTLSHGP